MNNKSQHTFTWLKVFTCFFIIVFIALILFINRGDDFPMKNGPSIFRFFNSSIFAIVGIVCLLGLALGLGINLLTKFRWSVLVYATGHMLSIFFCVSYIYVQFKDSVFAQMAPFDTSPRSLEFTPADSTITFNGDERHAIEEVLYLMEEQYPLGAYVLEDMTTKTVDLGVVCTIVFTIPDEGNKKYISQYIVKEGAPEPIYIKNDTTSAGYLEYKLEKTAK